LKHGGFDHRKLFPHSKGQPGKSRDFVAIPDTAKAGQEDGGFSALLLSTNLGEDAVFATREKSFHATAA